MLILSTKSSYIKKKDLEYLIYFSYFIFLPTPWIWLNLGNKNELFFPFYL